MAKKNGNTSTGRQRSGVEDVGMEYQYHVITYIAAAISENQTVENFTIFSNLSDIPGFDDLILKVWYRGKRHPFVYLGQIKHRASKINFETEKHKLADYKRDLLRIMSSKERIGFLQDVPDDNIEFLFYSNNTLVNANSIIIDKQVPFLPLLCRLEFDRSYRLTFPVEVSKECYKFVADNNVDDEDLLFLKKTRLLLNQSCNRKIIYDIRDTSKEELPKEAAFAISMYVREYFRIPTATSITKEVFETELLRIRLSKYIVSPTKAIQMKVEPTRMWNKITLDHDITMVDDCNNVESILCGCFSQKINDFYGCDFKWNDCINKSRILSNGFNLQPFIDRSKVKGIRYWLFPPDTIDLLLQEMWRYGDVPLILRMEGDVSILVKYKHLGKKFILISDAESKHNEMKTLDLRLFTNMADIGDIEERTRFFENILVSLQGRQPTSLKEVIGNDQLCMTALSCSEVLRLIQQRRPYLEEQSFESVELMIIIKGVLDEKVEQTEILGVNDSVHKNILITCHYSNVAAYSGLVREHPRYQNYSLYRLQEKRYGLQFISGDNDKVKHFLVDEDGSPVFYSTLDDCLPVIGKVLGRHEQVYISRSLRTPIIDQSIFNAKPGIYCMCGNIESLNYEIGKQVIKVTDFNLSDTILNGNENVFFDVRDYVDKTGKNKLDVHGIKTNRPVLFLKVVEGNLVLLSYKNCNDLSSYISYGHSIIAESLFFEWNSNQITAVSGEAGMGKTALLHSLSQAYNGSCYVLFCDLVHYTQELKQSKKVKFGLDYIFDKHTQTESSYNKLLRAIYKYCRTKRNVILFIDSFDEVLPVCEKGVLDFIKDIAKTNIRIIIASRIIATKLLFNQLEIYPLTIADLKVANLGAYLRSRNLSNTELSKMPKEFLANPLYLTFLIFLSEKRKLDFINIDLVVLYKLVILEKIERYHCKVGLLYDPEMEHLNEEVLEVHRLMALVAIFGEEWLVSRKIIQNYQKLVNQLKSQKIKLGIVKDFRNGYPVFVHQTLAEFLVAEWLIENLQEEEAAADIYRRMLTECDKNIQYLFDNMVCKDHKLHLAVIKGDLSLVQDLCSQDHIKIDDVDKCGRNCLHLASSYCFDENNYNIMELLLNQMLKEQYDFNTRDAYMEWNWLDYLKFRNPGFFERACCFGLTTALKVYLKFEKQLISESDISSALLNGKFRTLLFLFKMNKSLLARHFDRAFNIFVDRGCSSTACKLIQLHWRKNPRFNMFLNVCQNLRAVENLTSIEYFAEMKAGHFTMLHVACLHGHLQLVKRLLQSGARVSAVDDYKRTPLHYAVIQGSNDIVSLLLESGEIDINSKDENGQIPLHLAVSFSNLDIVRLLLENDANVSDKSYSGETVLEIATARGLTKICRILLEYGANIDEVNANGSSAFLTAAERGNLNIIRILLDYGADVSQTDCWGNTALHLASFQAHVHIVGFLVQKSPDLISIRNKSDLTPMEIMMMSQNNDINAISEIFALREEKMVLKERYFRN